MAPYWYLMLICCLLTACGSTEDLKNKEETQPTEPIEVVQVIENSPQEDAFPFELYRSKLSDAFTQYVNEIPDIYRADTNQTVDISTNNGFRVQLISTTDLGAAQKVQTDFDEWVIQNHPEYTVYSYLIFRQPHYRVHVGDFRSRSLAIEFSTKVKRRFRDAWVIYDNINPDRVVQ